MKKSRKHPKNKFLDKAIAAGDLLHLPSNVRLWKLDEGGNIATATKVTESPMVACYVESDATLKHPIGFRVYCDGEFWWVNEADVFLLESAKEKFNDY